MLTSDPPRMARRKSPGAFGRRVPRLVEKWLESLAHGGWHGQGEVGLDWVTRAKSVAEEWGCTLIYDPNHHWRESMYLPWDNRYGKKTILIGGAGASRTIGLSAFVHELAHHVLASSRVLSFGAEALVSDHR